MPNIVREDADAL